VSASALRSWIHAELGIMMPEQKHALLETRLQHRMRAIGLASLEAYGHYLETSPEAVAEVRELVSAVTTNTTNFFREPAQLDLLADTIVPAIVAADRFATVKVWSAGCSSGEEPYSIAMVLADLQSRYPGLDYAILATDISPRVLEYARRAIYPAEVVPAIPDPFHRYLMPPLDPEKQVVRIRPELRGKVAFHELNFMDPHYAVAEMFDVIYFRNVAIYFDPPTQDAVVTKLCRYLKPGGYLLIGHSESLVGRNVPVRHLAPSIYQRWSRTGDGPR
jgi:chemotaxis protein methyltransferase CheR